jgi:peptidoglycan hydrolase-like protein with peptidoglycan-binding domain
MESLKAAQQELRRLGCYAGGVDGTTGPQTRGALAAAAAKLGSGSGVQPLTEQGLRTLRDYKGVLCPPAIVVKAVPVEPTAPAAPSYAAPPVAAPAPMSASPPPPAVVSNPPPAPAPAPAAQEKKKIHISM